MSSKKSKTKSKESKTGNICGNCGKPYDYQLRVTLVGGVKTCVHDGGFQKGMEFDAHEKKLIKKLPPGKVLVKGDDRISRIADVVPDPPKRRR